MCRGLPSAAATWVTSGWGMRAWVGVAVDSRPDREFGREVQETNGCGVYRAVYRTDTATPTCELTACPLVACPHGPMIGFHAVVHLRSCRSVCGTTSARKSYQMWPGPLHLGPGHAGGGSGMLQHQRLP